MTEAQRARHMARSSRAHRPSSCFSKVPGGHPPGWRESARRRSFVGRGGAGTRQGTPYFNSAPVAAVFPVPVFSSRVFVVVVVNVVSFEKPAAPERIRHTPLVAAKYNPAAGRTEQNRLARLFLLSDRDTSNLLTASSSRFVLSSVTPVQRLLGTQHACFLLQTPTCCIATLLVCPSRASGSALHTCSTRARSAHHVDNLTVAHHVLRLVGRVVRLPRAAVLAHRRRRALQRVHPGARGSAIDKVLLERLGRLVHVGGHHLAHDTLELGRMQRLVAGKIPGCTIMVHGE
jgi:hypothetical protein